MQNTPASGYRTSVAGDLIHVSENGYSWSSTPHTATSVGGSTLRFLGSYVGPEDLTNRAYGFPVRCVQE